MKNLRCFLLLTCILAAAPAYAQGDFTIFGAVQHEGKLTLRSATQSGTTLGNFDPGTFGVFGLRFGHGRVFGGEHTLAYAPNFIDTRSKAVIYNSNFLLQAPLPKAKPYATAGLGTMFTFGEGFGDFGTKFAINYGGGLKVLPAGPVGVRFDIRGYALPSVKFNFQQQRAESQTLNILEVGLGLIFSFGQ